MSNDDPAVCERCGADTDVYSRIRDYPLGFDHWAPILCSDCRDDDD